MVSNGIIIQWLCFTCSSGDIWYNKQLPISFSSDFYVGVGGVHKAADNTFSATTPVTWNKPSCTLSNVVCALNGANANYGISIICIGY